MDAGGGWWVQVVGSRLVQVVSDGYRWWVVGGCRWWVEVGRWWVVGGCRLVGGGRWVLIRVRFGGVLIGVRLGRFTCYGFLMNPRTIRNFEKKNEKTPKNIWYRSCFK